MCGFAGIISFDEEHRFTQEDLAKMSRAIAHRGPDGEGFLINHTGPITPENPQVGLVFRRLAILDPDPRSDQPFTDGRHWLVFNGEIYNFRELKKELSTLRPDYVWRTTGDTEVLLLSYAVWGEKCVEHLNGMFAFTVWDAVEKSLYLARDRMGQKPLYVVAGAFGESFPATDWRMDQHGRFAVTAFSSEPESLAHLPWVEKTVDPIALPIYLRYGYTRWTFNESIGEISPGFDSKITNQSVTERRYFSPDDSSADASSAEAVDRTRDHIRRAVKQQLVSDVPVGVFLSGGVDSSIVAACARKIGPVITFSIEFGDPQYDETKFAVAVSKHLGTEHHVFRVTPNAAEDLPKLAAVFGTPFGDSSSLPTHYLAREARRHVKVALSGDGGDELFGGYDRYRAVSLAQRVGVLRHSLSIGNWLKSGNPKSKLTRLGRFIASLSLPAADRYETYLRLFDEQTMRELLVKPLAWDNRPTTWHLASLYERFRSEGRDDVQSALAVDRMTYLPDDLLTKVDRCSMLHGLEVRSPFMDHELVQFAAGLTTDQLLKGGPKRMLREAFADDLPAWVFKRKKMGFAVPIGDWFRGPLRAMLEDTLFAGNAFGRDHFDMTVVRRLVDEHQSKRVDHSQRLYALLMLELWWSQNRPV